MSDPDGKGLVNGRPWNLYIPAFKGRAEHTSSVECQLKRQYEKHDENASLHMSVSNFKKDTQRTFLLARRENTIWCPYHAAVFFLY